MAVERRLLVIADDYGIGPATSRGILRLCRANVVSGTVLLVNSPYAQEAVKLWKQSNPPADLGWHPCLTLDAPISPAAQLTSLTHDGQFHQLGSLIGRLFTGRIRYREVVAEFHAQLSRFRELVGTDPLVVNAHHHVQVFPIIGKALCEVLRTCSVRPYLRRVREPLSTLCHIRGARLKRTLLSTLGRRNARIQSDQEYPGSDWLTGITDPMFVHDVNFFVNCLTKTPGQVVELTCHPGEHDVTLLGRDAQPGDGNLERRTQELHLLLEPSFRNATLQAGYQICRPNELMDLPREIRRAA